MKKLDYETKIEIYEKYKKGQSLQSISKEYTTSFTNIRYMCRIIDLHGFEILRKNKNKVYPIEFKKELIEKVLNNNDSIFNIAAEAGLVSRTLLHGWVQKYEENGYNIVERKKGRSTMLKTPSKKEKNQIETDKEKIKRLEEENLYLKAELEYSKKLRAVVQARKNLQQKKK